MGKGIASVSVRRKHGHMIVVGHGRTQRGQKYIKSQVELEAKKPSDPNFKDELATAVKEILG